MNLHTRRGTVTVTVTKNGGVARFDPSPSPCAKSPLMADMADIVALATPHIGAVLCESAPVGPTGYLDQLSPESLDFLDPGVAVIGLADEYGRAGVALRLVRDDGERSVEVLHQRYEESTHPVVSATSGTAVVGGPVTTEELGRFLMLLAGDVVPAAGSSRPRWRLDR